MIDCFAFAYAVCYYMSIELFHFQQRHLYQINSEKKLQSWFSCLSKTNCRLFKLLASQILCKQHALSRIFVSLHGDGDDDDDGDNWIAITSIDHVPIIYSQMNVHINLLDVCIVSDFNLLFCWLLVYRTSKRTLIEVCTVYTAHSLPRSMCTIIRIMQYTTIAPWARHGTAKPLKKRNNKCAHKNCSHDVNYYVWRKNLGFAVRRPLTMMAANERDSCWQAVKALAQDVQYTRFVFNSTLLSWPLRCLCRSFYNRPEASIVGWVRKKSRTALLKWDRLNSKSMITGLCIHLARPLCDLMVFQSLSPSISHLLIRPPFSRSMVSVFRLPNSVYSMIHNG